MLYQYNILLGVYSTEKIYIVYVLLDACKQELTERFPEQDIFDKALLKISSNYVVLLSTMQFPFEATEPSHLVGGVCFCQFVRWLKSLPVHLKNTDF